MLLDTLRWETFQKHLGNTIELLEGHKIFLLVIRYSVAEEITRI